MRFIKVTKENKDLAKRLQAEIFPRDKSPEQVDVGIETGNPLNYICYEGDKIVGITGFYFQENLPDHILLNWFGVLPEERRKGYGSAILNECIKIAKELDFKYLTFWIEKYENKEAIELYKKLNFEVVDYCCEQDIKKFEEMGLKNVFVVGSYYLTPNAKLDFKEVDMQISHQEEQLNQFNEKI